MAVDQEYPCDVEGCGFVGKTGAGTAAHKRAKHGVEPSANLPVLAEEEGPEKADGKPKRTWRSLLGGGRTPKTPKTPKTPRSPWNSKDRVSGASVLGYPWKGLGKMLGPVRPITARMIEIQAPYAGYTLDQAVAGTLVDRFAVQPIARSEDRFMAAGAIFGPLVCTLAIENCAMHIQGATAPEEQAKWSSKMEFWIDALKEAIRESAPYLAKGIAAKKTADAELAKILADLYPDAPPDATPLDAMVSDILRPLFTPPPQPAPAQPQEEEASANV